VKLRHVILLTAGLLLATGAALAVFRWGPGPKLDLPPGIAAPDPAAAERIVFYAVGRQGYANAASRSIAAAMQTLAESDPPHFVALAGDNFHPAGPTSIRDPMWVERFEHLYDGPHLVGTPFFAVPGNHDVRGDLQAQFAYGRLHRGSGRWTMDGHAYARTFGTQDGRPLLRVLFIDTDELKYDNPARMRAELRELLESSNTDEYPYWTVVVGHYPLRSLTENALSRANVLDTFRDLFDGVDLYLSANDRFQQVIEVEGEPLHVSVNGGGDKQEALPARDESGQYVAPQAGFGRGVVEAESLTVELYDARGRLHHRVMRRPRRYATAARTGRFR
jgi:hypothetical protein